MRRLCEEHVTTTSAYQIFEVVFFVCSKLYSLLKSRKCGVRQYFERWVNLVISSLGGRYIICSKQDAQQNPPWRWGLFWYSPNILVEAVFETPHNVLVDKHTPVFLFIEAWSTSWRNSHIVIAGTVSDALHCTIWSLGPYGCNKCLLETS